MNDLSNMLDISGPVAEAVAAGQPVVALESTVISHGLPYPQSLETAQRLEAVIREQGALPATVGIIGGRVIVGLTEEHLEILATAEDVRKVSRRDFAIAAARKMHGATTVAGTLIGAHLAGVKIFATGGIGGVHRGDAGDVSADLPELGRTPMVVVCAGAKSILDLPRTLEYLETTGVPVLGYQTDEFPAFYARTSGLPVDLRVDGADEVAAILHAQETLHIESGILVTVPPSDELALANEEMEDSIDQALREADEGGVTGKDITPFLLSRISELTEGRSLAVNLQLLENNARVAAQIAVSYSKNHT